MSADNGIYVLKTKMTGDKPPYFVYRVIHAQAIENLYYDVTTGRHNENFTPEEVYSYFKECMPFFDEGEALCYAHKLADQHPILEYGVCILDHGEQTFETFSDEEMLAYHQGVDEAIEAYRKKRDEEWQKKREAAAVRFAPGDKFYPTRIVGYALTPEGERVYGSLTGEGIAEIKVGALNGDGADFLPSDWDRRDYEKESQSGGDSPGQAGEGPG
jgi:hypothetical protein